ncbi:MAG: HD domain-containing protein [Candidatus Omnitrophica bacterium]|nr:HD domain-containing protein [Candidatus Omnitrophota bacterium]
MACLNDIPELLVLHRLIQRKHISLFLVGGALRDLFLGRRTRDFDFAVSQDALRLAQSFAKAVKGTFVLLDKDLGCARVVKKRLDGLWTYDFANFRASTFKEDLKKRDFTINTLALDFRSLHASDDFRHVLLPNEAAIKDIRGKMIRMVAKQAFIDDPLRLLRAYSLMAQHGFEIEAKTRKEIKVRAKLITKVSPERVREELFKILESPRAALTLKAMHKDGLLFVVIPQLCVMEEIHQGGYHHLGVWEHSLETIHQLEILLNDFSDDTRMKAYVDEVISGGHSRRALLKFACLLHDIGKPDTKKKEEGRTSFHGHEHVGAKIARIIARQLMLSTKERHALEDMIGLHLRPGYLSNFKKPSERMTFRFFRDAKAEAVSILLLSTADQRSTRGPLTTDYDIKHHQDIAFPLIDRYFQKKDEAPFVRFIDGYDLIRKLKLEPGPEFSRILKEVEEAQHLGKVTTKAEALALALKVSGLKEKS